MTNKRPNAKEQKSLGFELIKGSWRITVPYVSKTPNIIEEYFGGTYEFQDLEPEDIALANKYNLKMYNIVLEGGTEKHTMYSYDARADLVNNHLTYKLYNDLMFYPIATDIFKSIPKMEAVLLKEGAKTKNWYCKGTLSEEYLMSAYASFIRRRSCLIPIPLEVDNTNTNRQEIVRYLSMHDHWRFGHGTQKDCTIDGIPAPGTVQNFVDTHMAIHMLVTKAYNHLRSYEYNREVAAYRNYMANNPEAFNAYLEEVNTDRLKINAKALAEVCLQIGNTISELDALKTGLMNMNVGLTTINEARFASNHLVERLNIFHRSLRACNKKFIHTNKALKGFPGIDE